MKKMLFTLSNILFLGIPYLVVRVVGGLTPDESESTFDKIKRWQVALRLEPFANKGEYEKCIKELFPDEGDRDRAEQFLVDLQRRFHFAASDRQKDLAERLPDRTFDARIEDTGVIEVAFDGRMYNSHEHIFCHRCRTPMYMVSPWGNDTRCGNCASGNTTPFYDLGEREYLSLLKEYQKGPSEVAQEAPDILSSMRDNQPQFKSNF